MPRRTYLVSLHLQTTWAVERRNLRPGGRIGQRKHGGRLRCHGQGQEFTVKRRKSKAWAGHRCLISQRDSVPEYSWRSGLRIRKALGSRTRITVHVTTRQVERLRALRIFFIKEKRAFEKKGEEGLTRIDAIVEEPNRKENLQSGEEGKSKPAPLKSARDAAPK